MDAAILPLQSGDSAVIHRFPSAVPFQSNRFLVALVDQCPVAYLAWRTLAEDELEILQLETMGSFCRNGLARLLLRTLKEQNPGSMFLEVRPSNMPALQLYRSEGFTEIGRRPGYYSEPPEEAIVLKFHS